MKLIQIFLPQFLFFCLISCANPQSSSTDITTQSDTTIISATENLPDSFPPKKIIENVVCKNDASQSYALYIPSTNKTNAIIYFFDPHADGALPLNKYKTLADTYNFILVGSNNSKNGNDFAMAGNIWQALFNDTKTRLQFDKNRIYICGFSGGAKVASYVALHHSEVKEIIACGAGLPDETPVSNLSFSFTAIAGKGDMNMTDIVVLNNALDNTQTHHRIILFDGKHEWAPENIMNIAFAGLQLDAMRINIIAKNDSFINAFIVQSKNRIDAAVKKNDYIQASNECKLSINILDGLTDVSFFKQKNNSIVNNNAYKNQLEQQQNLLVLEQNKKADFSQHFQQEDLNYWNATINDLNAKAKGTTAEEAMYQRLLAYLSLAFYSISNQLINNNQNNDAAFFVTLYKTVDPTNSEAWYFSAILNARNSNAGAANNDLLKAADNGFNDDKRMMQQPEFINLQSQINFSEIKAKMKKP